MASFCADMDFPLNLGQQRNEPLLAEHPAFYTANLVDQPIAGHVEGAFSMDFDGVVGEGLIDGSPAVADAGLVTLDIVDAIGAGMKQREPRSGKGYLVVFGLDQANSKLQSIVEIIVVPILVHGSFDAAVDVVNQLRRIAIRGFPKRPVDGPGGDQRHKGARNAVAGTVSDVSTHGTH
jgi:hypothetical protein